jgi:hypothetical protein
MLLYELVLMALEALVSDGLSTVCLYSRELRMHDCMQLLLALNSTATTCNHCFY